MNEIELEHVEDVRLIMVKLVKGFTLSQRIYLAKGLLSNIEEMPAKET